jgi:hypothetical protein
MVASWSADVLGWMWYLMILTAELVIVTSFY